MMKISSLLWPAFILSVFFIISFFLSLSETALVGLNKIRMRHMASRGVKNAKLVQKLVSHLDRLIATILVGNNFANIVISAIGTAIFIYYFGQELGIIMATLVVTFFVLVFLEITPKVLASQSPERVALRVAGPMNFLIVALRPVVSVFMAISFFLIRLIGVSPKQKTPLITEEELKLMIEMGREEGAVSDHERTLLHRIFEFGDTVVGDVMVTKDKMASIKIDATPEQLLDVLVEEGHSRIPVYKNTIDEIAGVIYARDLLHIWHNRSLVILPDLVQPAYFVKRDRKVSDVLKDFQRMKIQIAIVIDANNKTLGLVTLEDLIEEIVGEIEEERA